MGIFPFFSREGVRWVLTKIEVFSRGEGGCWGNEVFFKGEDVGRVFFRNESVGERGFFLGGRGEGSVGEKRVFHFVG